MKNISSRRSFSKPAASSKKKVVYRVKNWSAYNRSLIQRGHLTVWLSQEPLMAGGMTGRLNAAPNFFTRMRPLSRR